MGPLEADPSASGQAVLASAVWSRDEPCQTADLWTKIIIIIMIVIVSNHEFWGWLVIQQQTTEHLLSVRHMSINYDERNHLITNFFLGQYLCHHYSHQ